MAETVNVATIMPIAFVASVMVVTDAVDVDSSAPIAFVSSGMVVESGVVIDSAAPIAFVSSTMAVVEPTTADVDVASICPVTFTSSTLSVVEHATADLDITSTVALPASICVLHSFDYEPDILVDSTRQDTPIPVLAGQTEVIQAPVGGGLVEDSSVRSTKNVLVIIVDDVAREYLEIYDRSRFPEIPEQWANQWEPGSFAYPPSIWLDYLARHGLLLLRMNSAAMCSPTRASLLTGRDNIDHEVGNAIQWEAGDTAHTYVGTTIYELLASQRPEYERIHIGKWHVTENMQGPVGGIGPNIESSKLAFQRIVDVGGASYFQGSAGNLGRPPGIIEPEEQSDHTVFAWGIHDARENPRPFVGHAGGPFEGEANRTFDLWYTAHDAQQSNALVYTVEAAKQALRDVAEDQKPFMMNVWFNAPHVPDKWSDDQDDLGVEHLSTLGYHDYGAVHPGGTQNGAAIKAVMQSIDHGIGEILGAMTPAQRANTMVVVMSDNGTAAGALAETYVGTEPVMDILQDDTVLVPLSDYSQSHSKRSPWQGGIGASCVISGAGIVNPGDGVSPRISTALTGVEDLFRLICEMTGVTPTDPVGYHTRALLDVVRDEPMAGRNTYVQKAFQNGYASDMWNESQAQQIRFVSAQNAAGWKLIRVKANAAPSTPSDDPPGEVTWEWQLHNMLVDYLETDDLFWDGEGSIVDPASATLQEKYDALSVEARQNFNELYLQIDAENVMPPGLEVTLS